MGLGFGIVSGRDYGIGDFVGGIGDMEHGYDSYLDELAAIRDELDSERQRAVMDYTILLIESMQKMDAMAQKRGEMLQ